MKKYGMWVDFKIYAWVEGDAESAEEFDEQVRDMRYKDILDTVYPGDIDPPEYGNVEDVEE